jgi:hypothetical protein
MISPPLQYSSLYIVHDKKQHIQLNGVEWSGMEQGLCCVNTTPGVTTLMRTADKDIARAESYSFFTWIDDKNHDMLAPFLPPAYIATVMELINMTIATSLAAAKNNSFFTRLHYEFHKHASPLRAKYHPHTVPSFHLRLYFFIKSLQLPGEGIWK